MYIFNAIQLLNINLYLDNNNNNEIFFSGIESIYVVITAVSLALTTIIKDVIFHKYYSFIEPPVIEMPVPIQEIKVEEEVKEVPIPQPEPIPEPPPPERSPSPCEEEIEAEPLNYIEGVSKPYFHVNIKGTNHGGL